MLCHWEIPKHEGSSMYIIPTSLKLGRSYGISAVSHKYQFTKITDGYIITAYGSQPDDII